MRLETDCVPCFLSQTLNTVRRFGGGREAEERALRAVLEVLARADFNLPPPRIAPEVYAAIYRELGSDDPYAAIKRESTRQALALLPGLRSRVEAAEDPFAAAVRVSLAGNIIDFGTNHPFDLNATIERVLGSPLAVDHTDLLRRRLDQAREVLFLADNAGEVVLDRLLLERLPAGPRVTVAVRGGPIINDATLEDARAAGLDQLAPLVEPGVTLPGIALEQSSSELRRLYDQADVIIAKGQGNFETLESGPVFHLFMVKCEMVARLTGQVLGAAMVASRELLTPGRGPG
jgi:uncharacterized protein with ATP-grasp and redox domains